MKNKKFFEPSTECLIVDGLSKREFALFEAAKIPYSGSTGYCDPRLYPPLGPYIATFVGQIPLVMRALQWQKVTLEIINGQFVCRKARRKSK